MHAQTASVAQWWARSRGETHASWIENYQRSLTARHRDVIVAAIRVIPGVTSVLEVGCHCGPNLVRLAQELPTLEQVSGVDINPDAVATGQQWVRQVGLADRVELVAGGLTERMDALPSGCVDVVLSCYTLAYIAPSDLDAVLYDMGRLARRAMVLAEPMGDHGTQAKLALTGYHEWVHNYRATATWLGTWRDCALRVIPIDPPVDRLNAVLVAQRREPGSMP